MKTLLEIHKECGDIFKQQLLEDPRGSRSFACEIWDKMTCNEAACDNCIGENLNQLVQTVISEWFDSYQPNGQKIDFYVYTYMFWLYLFYERIEFVIVEVDPGSKYEPIQEFKRSLKTMDEIRLWANFIKHPKQFFYTHWPTFVFEGQKFEKNKDTIIVNTAFLKEHYSSEKQQVPKMLENNSTVVVQLPKLDRLTEGFCKEFLQFVRFICDNSMITNLLKKKSNKSIVLPTGMWDDNKVTRN